MNIGLEINEAMDEAIKRLTAKGVKFKDRAKGDGGSFVYFNDPDGNQLYLWQSRM